jgi:hypothetical protein
MVFSRLVVAPVHWLNGMRSFNQCFLIDICSLPDISAFRACGFRFGYVTIKWQLTYGGA